MEPIKISKVNVVKIISPNTEFDRNLQRYTILAEYIRGTLYELSLVLDENENFKPVYYSRLKNLILNRLSKILGLESKTEKETFHIDGVSLEIDPSKLILTVLQRLEKIGDIQNLGRGYYLPTPIRLVKNPLSKDVIIIGGCPTELLRKTFPAIISLGIGRTIVEEKLMRCNIENIVRQNYQDWITWLPEDLNVWIKGKFLKVKKSGTQSSETFLDFEVYSSTYEIYRRSKNNWLAAYTSQIKAEFDGVFLCRTRSPSSYFLGEFIDGKLKRELRISKEQMQWVQLGIRIQHGRKPFFYWQGSLLKVSPLLPFALERHISIYSIPIPSTNKGTLYFVPTCYRNEVENFLMQFGYLIWQKGGTPS